jgi:hypothetical protein
MDIAIEDKVLKLLEMLLAKRGTKPCFDKMGRQRKLNSQQEKAVERRLITSLLFKLKIRHSMFRKELHP